MSVYAYRVRAFVTLSEATGTVSGHEDWLCPIAGHETCSVPFVSCFARGDGVRSPQRHPATAVSRSDARSSYGRANELRACTGCTEERQRGEGRSTAPLRRSATAPLGCDTTTKQS